jgi:hypothetical protein
MSETKKSTCKECAHYGGGFGFIACYECRRHIPNRNYPDRYEPRKPESEVAK